MSHENGAKRPFPLTIPLMAVLVLIAIGLLRAWIPNAMSPTRYFNWWFDGSPVIVGYLLWLLAVPLLYRLFVFMRSRTWPLVGVGAAWALTGVVVSGLNMAISATIFMTPYYRDDPAGFENLLHHYIPSALAGWVSAFLEFGVIMAVFFAMDFYRRLRTRETEMADLAKQLSRAQLDALRMQLNPHFLFNALHSVASLMNEDTAAAQDMLAKLSFLMRRMLEGDENPRIRLDKEMEYIRGYLDIEQIRFKDRLDVRYDVDSQLADLLVPNLILQPLVENAVKHGFSRRADGGWVAIRARVDGPQLELSVTVDGGGLQDKGPRARNGIGLGIGLSNVEKRLRKLYGEAGTLTLASLDDGEFCATVTIPRERNS
jgi:two-component system LytT family sensor kinase